MKRTNINNFNVKNNRAPSNKGGLAYFNNKGGSHKDTDPSEKYKRPNRTFERKEKKKMKESVLYQYIIAVYQPEDIYKVKSFITFVSKKNCLEEIEVENNDALSFDSFEFTKLEMGSIRNACRNSAGAMTVAEYVNQYNLYLDIRITFTNKKMKILIGRDHSTYEPSKISQVDKENINVDRVKNGMKIKDYSITDKPISEILKEALVTLTNNHKKPRYYPYGQ